MFESRSYNAQYVKITYCALLLLALAACGPAVTPTYFIPPTAPNLQPTAADNSIAFITSTPMIIVLNGTPTIEPNPTSELPSPTPECTNVLTFLEDVTIPDGSLVAAEATFVKQWRIQNDGSCDWDSSYLLKLVSGDPLGAPTETVLYPARAGTEAIIEMTLTAPAEPGLYHTVWQAFDPEGVPFEQAIYVDFVVE